MSIQSSKAVETRTGNSMPGSVGSNSSWLNHSLSDISRPESQLSVEPPQVVLDSGKRYFAVKITAGTSQIATTAQAELAEQKGAGNGDTPQADSMEELRGNLAPVLYAIQSDETQRRSCSSGVGAGRQVCRLSENNFDQFRGSPAGSLTRTTRTMPNDQLKLHWRDGLRRVGARLFCSFSESSECVGCFDHVRAFRRLKLPCDHEYCSACFTRLITTAMGSESLWPPKCCDLAISHDTVVKKLSMTQRTRFMLKEKEFSTPAKDRWYCTRTSCAKWFEPKNEGDDWVKCPHCRYRMCRCCRHERHSPGTWCPDDGDLQATIRTADLNGWRACHKCFAMVELRSGCRHVTCTCGAQFCYVCGAPWHTCDCTETDQDERHRYLRQQRFLVENQAAESQTAPVRSMLANGSGSGGQESGGRRRANSYYVDHQRRVEPFVEFARRHRVQATSGSSTRSRASI